MRQLHTWKQAQRRTRYACLVGIPALAVLTVLLAYQCVSVVADGRWLYLGVYFPAAVLVGFVAVGACLTYRLRTSAAPVSLAEARQTDAGLVLLLSRSVTRLKAVFVVASVVGGTVFLVGKRSGALTFSMTDNANTAFSISATLVVGYALLFILFWLLGPAQPARIELSARSVTFCGAHADQTVAWTDIVELKEIVGSSELLLRVMFRVGATVEKQIYYRGLFAETGGLDQCATVRADRFGIGARALRSFLQHYVDNPEDRAEFADGRAYARLQGVYMAQP